MGDWRITNQADYLKGKRLILQTWTAPKPGWDHDHCEFCGAKFMDADSPGILREGYATDDRYHWVCQTCFNDFQSEFGWTT